MQTKIRNIEIVYQEKPQLIFFPSHPLFEFLSDQTKDKIMFTIDRETQREKIIGLLDIQKSIFNEIEYNHKLNQLTIPVTHKTILILRKIAATLSIMVNALMILFYNITVKNKIVRYYAEFEEEVILSMLSLLQFTCSTALFIVYLINCGPLALKQKPENIQSEEGKRGEKQEANEDEDKNKVPEGFDLLKIQLKEFWEELKISNERK